MGAEGMGEEQPNMSAKKAIMSLLFSSLGPVCGMCLCNHTRTPDTRVLEYSSEYEYLKIVCLFTRWGVAMIACVTL